MEENTPKAQDGSLEDDDRITHEASQALNGSPLKIHTGKASSDDESEEKEEKEEKDESSACDDSPDSAALRKKRTKPWDRWKNRTDDQEPEWWFASTAIPLLAATIAPLANVFSIAALVSYWRTDLEGGTLAPFDGIDIKDPGWVYGTNLTSLICGYVGNLFLFLNFTNRIPYIFALPVTIILWYISTGILVAIQVCMHLYAPPGPGQDYTQAFWYGVIASVLYLFCSMLLMVNMVGYFRGHYPSHFNLTEAQRTLILQTFLFFIWLAGGAAVFSKVQSVYGLPDDASWNFSQALYFCDVTILTIGFGDLTPDNNVGRGFVLPYSVGGIIMLGLMISSISQFATELSNTNIVQKRVDKQRLHTLQRTKEASTETPTFRVLGRPGDLAALPISSPIHVEPLSRGALDHHEPVADQLLKPEAALDHEPSPRQFLKRASTAGVVVNSLMRTTTNIFSSTAAPGKRHRRRSLLVLREEKDRFDAMRKIQHNSARFKKWSALISSVTVLILLWFIGAIVFWLIEKDYQPWSYFDSIYFCYVSLLTIGYGEFTPKTNAGRPFFVVWSLLAVPSITILISDLANTVVSSFRDWTNALGDFTLLAQDGIWRDLVEKNPWLIGKLTSRAERKAREKRLEEGFGTGPDPDAEDPDRPAMRRALTIEQLAAEGDKVQTEHQLAKLLANTIKDVAGHVKDEKPRKYSYEEWVEFTELVRFTRGKEEEDEEDEDEGLIEWDWIGEDGPIMSSSEPQWLLDRLCESMGRYVRKQARIAEGKTVAHVADKLRQRIGSRTPSGTNSGQGSGRTSAWPSVERLAKPSSALRREHDVEEHHEEE